jgi:hypothetical protein
MASVLLVWKRILADGSPHPEQSFFSAGKWYLLRNVLPRPDGPSGNPTSKRKTNANRSRKRYDASGGRIDSLIRGSRHI